MYYNGNLHHYQILILLGYTPANLNHTQWEIATNVSRCISNYFINMNGFSTAFFPKQFTVGVLNAILDLAALVLVGVVGFLGSEVVLSPVVSGCLPSCGGWVLVGVAAFLGSEVVLSSVVSGCLPSCGGWVLVGVAASRTKTFRNQNHRFQSKFAYCKLFGVYAGVILNFYQRLFFGQRFFENRKFLLKLSVRSGVFLAILPKAAVAGLAAQQVAAQQYRWQRWWKGGRNLNARRCWKPVKNGVIKDYSWTDARFLKSSIVLGILYILMIFNPLPLGKIPFNKKFFRWIETII